MATHAQVQDTSATNSPFIKSYSDKISLALNLNNQIEIFQLRTPNLDYDLYPNTYLATSIKFSFDFIIFSISTSPEFIGFNSDTEIRGNTNLVRYETNLSLGRRINQFISYQKIEGFYLNNTIDFIPTWEKGDPYLQIPQLSYTSLGGNTTFSTNQNYSLFAFTAINQKQLKSAGSFIYNFTYRYFKIDNNALVTETISTQRSDNLEFVANAGYAYTWVIHKNLYVASGANLGAGLTRTKLTTRLIDQNFVTQSQNLIYSGAGFVSFGFDNGRFFSGAALNGYRSERFQGDTNAVIFDNRFSVQIFLGYRFKAPNFMKRTTRKIRDILPVL